MVMLVQRGLHSEGPIAVITLKVVDSVVMLLNGVVVHEIPITLAAVRLSMLLVLMLLQFCLSIETIGTFVTLPPFVVTQGLAVAVNRVFASEEALASGALILHDEDFLWCHRNDVSVVEK
jgi:hypothetical protein